MPYSGGFPSVTLKGVRARYDFASDGGAVGDIDLSASIPANAYVLFGFVEVDTVLASSGEATAALKLEGAADLVASAAFDAAPWSSTGRKSIVPVATGATSVKTTDARKIRLTVGTAALTGGAFDVVLFYVVVPD